MVVSCAYVGKSALGKRNGGISIDKRDLLVEGDRLRAASILPLGRAYKRGGELQSTAPLSFCLWMKTG